MTECNKCGDCCEVIPFYVTKEELAQSRYRDWQNQYNVAFILEHWQETPDQTLRHSEIFGKDANPPKYLYTCDMFDIEARLCTAHDDRPAVCSDYPWYNKNPSNMGDPYLSKNCSFWADVPVSIKSISVAFKS